MDANRMKTQRMGVLVVGAGSHGSRRAAAVKATNGLELVAVIDQDIARSKGLAARLGCEVETSFEHGLRRDDIHVVIVATPHAEHDETVRAALEAGKHVLCEKPLTTDADSARSLALLADRRQLRLATGFNHRFYRPIRDAYRLVTDWRIGRVESVRLTIGHRADSHFLAGWHTDRAISGGGTMMDNGVHACDLARLFLGDLKAVQGYVRDAVGLPFGVESEAFALFRNHERGVAEIRSSWTLRSGYLSIEIRGSSGFLNVEAAPWRLSGVLDDGSRIDRRYAAARVAERLFRARHGCERSLVCELEAFLGPRLSGPSPNATGWDGAHAVAMVEAFYEAASHGRETPIATRTARVQRGIPGPYALTIP